MTRTFYPFQVDHDEMLKTEPINVQNNDADKQNQSNLGDSDVKCIIQYSAVYFTSQFHLNKFDSLSNRRINIPFGVG